MTHQSVQQFRYVGALLHPSRNRPFHTIEAITAHPTKKYCANHMPTDLDKPATNKNAAPKGRIKGEWIAKLFLQKLSVFISNSIAAELIAALY